MLLRVVSGLLGALYVVAALIAAYNWAAATIPIVMGAIAADTVPGDLGMFIVYLAIGLSFLVAALCRRGEARRTAFILAGAILGSAALAVQLLVAVASVADSYVLMLAGEEAELQLLPLLGRADVILGLPSLVLLRLALSKARALGIRFS